MILDEGATASILKCRRQLLKKARRVVIKVGSAVLTAGDGMNHEVIENLAAGINALRQTGIEVILVSSGAVAAGRKKLAFTEDKELTLMEKQALAAIGQSCLMHIYDSAFEKHGMKIGQALLTHDDLSHRVRYVNFKNTVTTLLKMDVMPVINENDTVSTEELQFGDNDNLGALVTNLIEADMFICLTDVDCLYTAHPLYDRAARPLHTVDEVTAEIVAMAGNSGSSLGTGGMRSKILAAQKVAAGGGASLIGPGKSPRVLQDIFAGEMVGTFFLPRRKRLQGRKQWIAFVLKPNGIVEIDAGASEALCRGGKSLLPSGVRRVHGNFCSGDSVECRDENGRIIAVGTVNYRAEEVIRIMGGNSQKIEDILGYKSSDEVIHRDNLVIL